MPYTFDQIFAVDPANPSVVAAAAQVVIFTPGDVARTPLPITDTTGIPIPNPITTNEHGFGPAFIAGLDRVAWEGGGLSGFLTSYEGLKDEAVAASLAAQMAQQSAADSQSAAETAASLVEAPAGDVIRTVVEGELDAPESGLSAKLHEIFASKGDLGAYATHADVAGALRPVVTIDNLPATGLVSAHRGGGATGPNDSPVAPDNSLAGLRTAMMMGAHILDVDYRTTADGVMVAMHDTTVDRTTNGTGLVTDHVFSALPNVAGSKAVGTGWPDERVPSIEEIFIEFGGKAILTIEAKEGVAAVAPLAALIKKHRLERSVFINTNSVAVVSEIVAQGCLAHLFAHQDTALITPGIAAGATLLEVPYNTSAAIVAECQAAMEDPSSNLRWFIAGPIATRTQMKAITPGIMGHVTDALGMTNRVTGDAPLVKSILPSLRANKRGIGWRTTGPLAFENKSIVSKAAPGDNPAVYLGDMSGTMPGTYTIRMKIVATAPMVGTATAIRARVAATIPDQDGRDQTTDGYICNIRGNGQINLWSSNGAFGSGILLGQSTGDPALVAGTEYTLRVDITPWTITLTREDTGAKVGPMEDNVWRGGHHYIWFAGGDTVGSRVTDFTRS